MKKALVVFNMDYVHLGKDTFLFPYYLCKKYNYSLDFVTVATKNNENLPTQHRGANIIRINNSNKKNTESVLTKYIITHAKEYELLILFHYRALTVLRSYYYKKNNSNGKIYVKLDMGIGTFKDDFEVNGFRCLRNKLQLLLFQKYCDICSVEGSTIYNKLFSVWEESKRNNCILDLLPNGFDEEEFKLTNLKVKSYEEKQNVLITVGRLGSYEKNTEFLLRILDKLNLKNWKVKLIGPYTDEVLKLYKEICMHNKCFMEKVELTGNITDKQLLFSYYNDAKIFVLPSRWESFGLVLIEAMYFGNYIITSPIICANDLTDFGRIGSILPINEEKWIKELQKMLDDNNKLNKLYPEIINYSKQKYRMEQIINNANCFDILK